MNPVQLLAIALASLVVPGSALAQDQGLSRHRTPEVVAATRRLEEIGGRARALVAQAREAMRLGQFDKTILLCDRAAIDLNDLGGREFATEAYEVLAEAALLQGDPTEALRQCDACAPRLVVQRFAMTKALALIGVGRVAEAREIVLAQIGTLEKPGSFRRSYHIHSFPMDTDGSLAALTATAHLVRATWWQAGAGRPEVISDLRAAVQLAPESASVRLQWADSLAWQGDYGAARAEFAKARALGDKYIQDKVKRGIVEMDRIIADRAARKAAGTTSTP